MLAGTRPRTAVQLGRQLQATLPFGPRSAKKAREW